MWLEDPEKRPTFAMVVQNLRNIHDFKETTSDDESIKDTKDTPESNGYISVLPQ